MMNQDSRKGESTPSSTVSTDLFLELNFVPDWARQPPGPNPYSNRKERKRDDRKGTDGRQRGKTRHDRHSRDARGKSRTGRQDRRSGRDGSKRTPQSRDLGLQVRFLADRAHLAHLAREITRSEKAYPIIEVASMLMRLPEHYVIKLETGTTKDKSATDLHQCTVCQMVYLRQSDLERHVIKRHLNTVFEVEHVEGEPPTGKFVCVGRCTLTGTLLGPPNYHGYQQKIQELIHAQFPNLSVAQFRNTVEMVHDKEVIEQWRKESQKKTIYRRRQSTEPSLEQPVLSWDAARKEFTENHLHGLVRKTHRALLPAIVAQNIQDPKLLEPIRMAWNKESRFPLSMALTMRPGFRHMHLHLFKANRKAVFVTSIRPRPLDPAQAIPDVAKVLRYLKNHPGCSREAMLQDLYPEATEESPEAIELNGRLRWLIERGHIIHFYNGALSVPSSVSRATSSGPKRPRSGSRKNSSPGEKKRD